MVLSTGIAYVIAVPALTIHVGETLWLGLLIGGTAWVTRAYHRARDKHARAEALDPRP